MPRSANRWAVAGVGSVAALAFAMPVLPILALPARGVLGGNISSTCSVAVTSSLRSGWATDQLAIARTALQVAATRHLPARAGLVILAAGLQESGLHNLTYGDRDSVGWLQQRAGWGSLAERMNPAYAAGKFFDALVTVPGWQTMAVTAAAQAVQISGFPNAYAKWEIAARQLLGLLGSAPTDQCPTTGGGPVPATFDQLGNPHTVAQAIATLQAAMPNGGGQQVLNACEHWMGVAYGRPASGFATARAHWDAPGPRAAGYSVPPRGALVFWQTSNAAGHVALSLGGGAVISTDFDGHGYAAGIIAAGPITAIDQWGPRLGWRPPDFQHVL